MNLAALALTLTGLVHTGDGRPLQGASVTVRSATPVTVVTDSSGQFQVPDVTLPVEIVVEADGFASRTLMVDSSSVEVELLPASVSASVLVLGDSPGRDPATGTVHFDQTLRDHSPGLTIDEVLRPVAGLSLFRRSSARTANPTTHGVTMRGLSASGASRGVVIFDGLPLNDGFGAWVTWTRVPSGAMESIDVIPGAAGDLFGSDALGGVIRLRSPTPASVRPTVNLAAGTRETFMGDVSLGVMRGRTALWLAASAVDTAGEIGLEAASRGVVDRPLSANWWSGFARVDVTEGPRRWTLATLGGRDRRGNGTVVQRNRNAGATVSAAVQSVGGSATWAARLAVTPNRFIQSFSAVSDTRASEFLVNTQTIDVTTTRAVVEYGRVVPRGYVMVRAAASRAGADFEQVRPSSTSLVSLRDNAESVSAQVALTPTSTLTVGGGLRHEWRAAPDETDGRDQATVGRLSASWKASDVVVVRSAFATSHRWPTLNELTRGFRVGDTSTLANAALMPERARTFDVGVTFTRSIWSGGVTVFSTVVRDAIANVTLPSVTGIVRQRTNAGRARVVGLETELEGRPAPWLHVRGSLAVTDATFRESKDPVLEGNRLPQVPKVTGTLAFNVRPSDSWRVDVVARSLGSQFDDDRNRFELAAAHQLDSRVTLMTSRVQWGLVVENLFDADVEVARTPLVRLAPGRAARVSATWRWR